MDGLAIFAENMEGYDMRIKTWLWISMLALLIGSASVYARTRDQDRDDRSRDNREAVGNAGRTDNSDRDKAWREYLKERKKSYKEWEKADRKEQQEFEKYYQDRRRDSHEDFFQRGRENAIQNQRDRWENQQERDREWRDYLKQRKWAYKEYERATRVELDQFYSYLGDRGYRYDDQRGFWGRYGEPRDGACFYKDTEFRGARFCLSRNEDLSYVGDRFNDKISSIRVFGRARVIIYKNKNYHGSRRTYTGDAPHLGEFNEEISSIEMR